MSEQHIQPIDYEVDAGRFPVVEDEHTDPPKNIIKKIGSSVLKALASPFVANYEGARLLYEYLDRTS